MRVDIWMLFLHQEFCFNACFSVRKILSLLLNRMKDWFSLYIICSSPPIKGKGKRDIA